LGYFTQPDKLRRVAKTKFTEMEDAFLQLLKALRLEKNFTQKQLADRLGVPQSYVSKYETGERRLDFVETAYVCEALGITIQQFSKMLVEKVKKSNRA
jgi:transcriptional regulator with XRE-family HTH domain